METEPMNPGGEHSPVPKGAAARQQRLSYKFQRVREKLRQAILNKEFTGKLPGERQLAKRFRANAKTISKALTDLAAEGLLERGIGRGTFVKHQAQAATPPPAPDRWLLICAPDQLNLTLIRMICQANAMTTVISDSSNLRPSFLNQFKAVIDLASAGTSEQLLRDMVVRGLNVVLVDRESESYLMNAVEVDRTLGASCLARDLMLQGHRHFLAVERRGHTIFADTIRRAAQRYAPDSVLEAGGASDTVAALERGVTAFLCDTRQAAIQVREIIQRRGMAIPAELSLAAVGAGLEEYPCTGYFVHARQKADAIVNLLRDGKAKRPTTLWITGNYIERGTTAPPPMHLPGINTVVMDRVMA